MKKSLIILMCAFFALTANAQDSTKQSTSKEMTRKEKKKHDKKEEKKEKKEKEKKEKKQKKSDDITAKKDDDKIVEKNNGAKGKKIDTDPTSTLKSKSKNKFKQTEN